MFTLCPSNRTGTNRRLSAGASRNYWKISALMISTSTRMCSDDPAHSVLDRHGSLNPYHLACLMLLLLALSLVFADVQFCDSSLFGPESAHEFLRVHNVAFTDLKSFIIIDPGGPGPLNLVAHFEHLQNRQMILRLGSGPYFSPNECAVYQWPQVKQIFFEISRIGLSPVNLAELEKLQERL